MYSLTLASANSLVLLDFIEFHSTIFQRATFYSLSCLPYRSPPNISHYCSFPLASFSLLSLYVLLTCSTFLLLFLQESVSFPLRHHFYPLRTHCPKHLVIIANLILSLVFNVPLVFVFVIIVFFHLQIIASTTVFLSFLLIIDLLVFRVILCFLIPPPLFYLAFSSSISSRCPSCPP